MATEVITGNDIEYRIIADKGVVVCKLFNCSDIAVSRIEKYTKFNVYSCKYDINDTYVGVAKCAPEDTFDVNVGKKIALAKAKQKRNNAINRMIIKFKEDRLNDIDRLMEYGVKKPTKNAAE